MSHTRTTVTLALAVLLAFALGGCGRTSTEGDGAESTGTARPAAKPAAIRIGTLPTEDTLPLWVAQDAGLFADAGLADVEIVAFQSAQERDAALTAGAIDAFMGDIIAAANLEAAGTPVTIATIMLGSTPAEGRFGIVAPKGSTEPTGAAGLRALAGVPVGTSSATIQEYVLDGLMRQAGVVAADVKKEEVKKVPVRFELLMQGKLKAAALPEPFLSLAEAQGAVLVADDTTGENLSQTVLVVSDAYFEKEGGPEAVDAVLAAWDKAVASINGDPDSFRPVLVDKARLPEPLAETYRVNTYPMHQLPTPEQVEAVTVWMKDSGYLKKDVTYEDLTVVLP